MHLVNAILNNRQKVVCNFLLIGYADPIFQTLAQFYFDDMWLTVISLF